MWLCGYYLEELLHRVVGELGQPLSCCKLSTFEPPFWLSKWVAFWVMQAVPETKSSSPDPSSRQSIRFKSAAKCIRSYDL